jgi:hypothetical protein
MAKVPSNSTPHTDAGTSFDKVDVRCHGKVMERFATFIAAASVAAHSLAAEPTGPLSCVPANACGCAIVISAGSCPSRSAHFFHELTDGSPLQFNPGRGPATAASTRPQTNIFSPTPGDSWTESYRFPQGRIEIRYAPGINTCPKVAQGEQCEYFDVRARVVISGPEGTRSYSGAGACGC